MPRPPRYTLFPYTTLFRSNVVVTGRTPAPNFPVTPGAFQTTLKSTAGGFNAFVSRLNQKRDRKSTRMNSSHVAISYAVFCLKKKKTIPDLFVAHRNLLFVE